MSKEKEHHIGTVLRPPEHDKKKFSDGMRATFKSIRKFWERKEDGKPPTLRPSTKPRSVEDFEKDFGPVFQAMQRHYGAVKPNRKISKAVENIEMGNTELPFYQERAYAEYVGLPTGVLMLFTNVMSDATQKHTKKSILNLLISSQAAIQALIAHVNAAPDLPAALFTPIAEGKEGLEYVAKLEGLAKMVDRFHQLRTVEHVPETT